MSRFPRLNPRTKRERENQANAMAKLFAVVLAFGLLYYAFKYAWFVLVPVLVVVAVVFVIGRSKRVAQEPRSNPPPLPAPRLIKTWMDAEVYARDFLRAVGFVDAQTTGNGRDGGVDVRGRNVVAQVKMEAKKTETLKLQALAGIASVERKTAAFFSLSGYSKEASDWAERSQLALFEFDYSGGIIPRSSAAARLLKHGHQ